MAFVFVGVAALLLLGFTFAVAFGPLISDMLYDRAYTAGEPAVSWGECQVAATGLTKLLEPVVDTTHIADLDTAIARELEAPRLGA